ncbi:MAG: hypothetical protein DRQ47_03670 [Gammaproteobacteria bacterium]|nr:MAG: hypothetical protein DRQ47_03670 [Gammaproteobacteria bacterium]
MGNKYILVLFIMVGLLTSCSANKTTPPVEIYTLIPVLNKNEIQLEIGKSESLIISLSPIRASRGLMGPEVVYTDMEHGYNSYAYSRWSDSPARLLELFFQQSLQQVAAVVPSESISKADLLLEGTLYDFSHQLKNDDTSYGVVRIRFYLIDNKTRVVLATELFSSEVAANTRNAKGATAALNKASNNIAEQLSVWMKRQINQLPEK